MTASVDLYRREGSRFVRVGDTLIARHVPPIPVPVVVDEDPLPNVTRVTTYRCPHGHYSSPGGLGRGCTRCRPTTPRKRTR